MPDRALPVLIRKDNITHPSRFYGAICGRVTGRLGPALPDNDMTTTAAETSAGL